MTIRRTSLWSAALLVVCGVAMLAQQQAAEAPATDWPIVPSMRIVPCALAPPPPAMTDCVIS